MSPFESPFIRLKRKQCGSITYHSVLSSSLPQVLSVDNKARILVCAPSNSAADNLLERLYHLYKGPFKRDVIRIISAGRPAEGVGALPEALKDFAP
jgi:hypothetical protein